MQIWMRFVYFDTVIKGRWTIGCEASYLNNRLYWTALCAAAEPERYVAKS